LIVTQIFNKKWETVLILNIFENDQNKKVTLWKDFSRFILRVLFFVQSDLTLRGTRCNKGN